MAQVIIGSSLHQATGNWQVWFYDELDQSVTPLGTFSDKKVSDASAFDAIHSTGKRYDPAAIAEEVAEKGDGVPTAFSPKEEAVIRALVADAIKSSVPGGDGQFAVSTRTTATDQIYVGRFD
jgi:hypothetical protein